MNVSKPILNSMSLEDQKAIGEQSHAGWCTRTFGMLLGWWWWPPWILLLLQRQGRRHAKRSSGGRRGNVGRPRELANIPSPHQT